MTPSIDWNRYANIVVLTGAGISVGSGLRPYRGPNGLWEEGDTARVSDRATFDEDPLAVWQFFGALRTTLKTAQPNAAHVALAQLQKSLGAEQTFTLITQNIDGLHQRAGNTDVIELHGSIASTRCSNDGCDLPPFADDDPHGESVPLCPACGAPLRPDIVLFGEIIPAKADWLTRRALRACDLFLAIGTSGLVSPASQFVRSAKYMGATTVLINLEPMSPRNEAFDDEMVGPAEVILPRLMQFVH